MARPYDRTASTSSDADDCPHISSCEMFTILTYAGTLGAWKARYCNGDHESCARFQAASKGKKVPINLMPNGALLRKGGA